MNHPEPLVERDPFVEWDQDRAGELAALWSAAMPNDPIGVDDVEAVCFCHGLTSPDDVLQVVDAVTIATASGSAAATVTVTGVGEHRSAHLQLLVVHPSRRSRGIGRALVAAAEQWVLDRGIDELTVGGAAPFYLFTGIDSRWTPAVCLFESLGYERSGAELDLSCPTRGGTARRAGTDDGTATVVVEPVGDDDRAAALMTMVERDWPLWSAEFRRAAEAGTVAIARDGEGGPVLGAAAHSVSRFGVVGPVAVSPDAHGRGIGSVLMSAVLEDLSVAGLRTAEIAWTSTVRFYAKACGATIARTSLLMRRSLREV